MHQVVGLRARIAAQGERLRQHDAAPAVAARIEQQHVVVVERPLEPVPTSSSGRGPGNPGPSLQEHEPGPRRVGVLRRSLTARAKIVSDSPDGPVVIERHDECVVGQVHSVMANVGERTEVSSCCLLVVVR